MSRISCSASRRACLWVSGPIGARLDRRRGRRVATWEKEETKKKKKGKPKGKGKKMEKKEKKRGRKGTS